MVMSALPAVPPSTADPANFDARADALLGALPLFITQANALEANVVAKELSVNNLVTAALSAGLANAATNATIAFNASNDAQNFSEAAEQSAESAFNSKNAAAASAAAASAVAGLPDMTGKGGQLVRANEAATAFELFVLEGTPPGAVAHFALAAAPSGWLSANGAAISRATYAALFAAIGTTFGAGNGTTTFNIPDLRGKFLRSLDEGRGVDPSRVLGSDQASDNLSHTHLATTNSAGSHAHNIVPGVAFPATGTASTTASLHAAGYTAQGASNQYQTVSQLRTTQSDGSHTHNFATDARGGTESRPTNVALLVCIKF